MIPEYLSKDAVSFQNALYTVYYTPEASPVSCVAACAPLVTKAAEAGDPIALDILTRAGKLLAQQLVALQRKNDLPPELPVALSGSVWLGHKIIFSEFQRILREEGLGTQIIIPTFQPIVGMILCHYYATHGKFTSNDSARFRDLYRDYLFNFTK